MIKRLSFAIKATEITNHIHIQSSPCSPANKNCALGHLYSTQPRFHCGWPRYGWPRYGAQRFHFESRCL